MKTLDGSGTREGTVNTVGSRGMVLAAASAGVDVAAVLSAVGVEQAVLDDPDGRMSGAVQAELWRCLREASGNDAIHLTAHRFLPDGSYRILDNLLALTPTLGQWFERFVRYVTIIHSGVAPVLEQSSEDPTLALALANGSDLRDDWGEYTLAALIGRARRRAYPSWRPLRVEVRREKPAHVRPWEDAFHAPVIFNAPLHRLVVREADWTIPSKTANPGLSEVLEAYAALVAERAPLPAGIIHQTKAAVSHHLQEGAHSTTIAQTLKTSVRSLQRALAEHGSTYSGIVEEVRSDLAMRHLRAAELPIGEVAYLLGFSEQSSFQRAFKRWTGKTPGQWRRSERTG